MSFYEELVERSKIALADPKVGDRWQEAYSWWLYVVKREGDSITTIEASGPCELPRDGKVWTGSVQAFRKRLSYGSIPGTWCKCDRRGEDVSGWVK